MDRAVSRIIAAIAAGVSVSTGCGGGGGGSSPAPPKDGTILDFSGGFPTSINNLLVTNVTTNQPGLLGQPTKQSSSLFTASPFVITKFDTTFTFQIPPGPSDGDGLTFCVQGLSPTALGGYGDKLGYGNIGQSVAVKFDTFMNPGDPSASCTGIFVDGVLPVGGTDLLSSSIDLHSGDTFAVNLSYDGHTLSVTIRDTTTNATANQAYIVDIPSDVGGSAAYVGFTSASDVGQPGQQILTWKIATT